MNKKSTNILNSFIGAPTLKIDSRFYPFSHFNFSETQIAESDFHFPYNSIIGLQAEACFEAYLTHSKHYELLVSNLQIPGDNQTLGELDYIVRNLETDEVLHIELACKFYLYDIAAGNSEEARWIGPNRKDSLLEKLEKIRSKQFPLINFPETIEHLKRLKIEIPTSQKLCIKAFLFTHKKTEINLLNDNYKACIVGYWIYNYEFNEEDVDSQYAIPSKKEWLLPLQEITSWLSFTETKLEIDKHLQQYKSAMVYKRKPQSIERLFVVWW